MPSPFEARYGYNLYSQMPQGDHPNPLMEFVPHIAAQRHLGSGEPAKAALDVLGGGTGGGPGVLGEFVYETPVLAEKIGPLLADVLSRYGRHSRELLQGPMTRTLIKEGIDAAQGAPAFFEGLGKNLGHITIDPDVVANKGFRHGLQKFSLKQILGHEVEHALEQFVKTPFRAIRDFAATIPRSSRFHLSSVPQELEAMGPEVVRWATDEPRTMISEVARGIGKRSGVTKEMVQAAKTAQRTRERFLKSQYGK